MKYFLFCAFLILVAPIPGQSFEQVGDARVTHYDPMLTLTVGTGMFVSPIIYPGKIGVMSGWEHNTFGFAWTELGFKFLPKDINWASPFLVSLVFWAYYIDQLDTAKNQQARDLTWTKVFHSQFGIVSATILQF